MAMERAATTAPADFRADPGALEAAARLKRRYDGADPLSRLPDVHPDRIPRHIAFIMDGNGRWAARQGMPRVLGHRAGAVAARAVARECGRLGVECVTLYSFSLENWKRPKAEIDALMELCVLYLDKEREELRREQRSVSVTEGVLGTAHLHSPSTRLPCIHYYTDPFVRPPPCWPRWRCRHR